MVISNTSKNPERALAFWNLLTTDQEVYDALMYGVEGTTYTLNEKGEFAITDTDLYGEGAMWCTSSDKLTRNQAGTPDDYDPQKQAFEQSITAGHVTDLFAGFVFDTSSIET